MSTPLKTSESQIAPVAGASVTSAPLEAMVDSRSRDLYEGAQRNASGALPVSPAQERLWVIDQFSKGTPIYNMVMAVSLEGVLHPERARWAFDAIMSRHQVLRTVFREEDGKVFQIVVPNTQLHFRMLDFSQASAEKARKNAMAVAAEEMLFHFDLERGPLFRCTLMKLAEREHWLITNVHHIVCDDWSVGILAREFGELYTSACQGRQSRLPQLPLQYADYAVLQKAQSLSPEMTAHRAYWASRLANLEELRFPDEKERSAPEGERTTSAAIIRKLSIPGADLRGLRALAQRSKASVFMVFTAGLTALLRHLCGQTDIAIGLDVAGRDSLETENLIGLFVNQVVLRIDVSGNPKCGEVIRRVQQAMLAAHEHQALPFEQVVSRLRPARAWNTTPLFRVKLVQVNAIHQELAFSQLRIRPIELAAPPAKFDLMVEVADIGQEVVCTFKTSADLFGDAEITRLANTFQKLIRIFKQDPELRLDGLEGLVNSEGIGFTRAFTETQKQFNHTRTDYSGPMILHRLIEEQAMKAPNQIAVMAGEEILTRGTLEMRANQLAHWLRTKGIGLESRVCVCLERGLDLIVTLLAILKAGGVYVPLDPDYPRKRLALIMEDAVPDCLVTDTRFRKIVSDVSCTQVYLDVDTHYISQQPVVPPATESMPDNAAYIIFTSGSTGRPKGAVNTHRAICNRLQWMQETCRINSDDRVLHKTPLNFDVSIWELFWPLMTEATQVLAIAGGQKESAYLVWEIQHSHVSVVHFVPSMLAAFLEEPEVERCATLRHVICSGEVLSPELCRQFFLKLKVDLHNLYGPTEAAVDVTAWHCRREEEKISIPIGHPIANTRIYILGQNGHPVRPDETGEIFIGGVAPARAYVGHPELTAQSFLPDVDVSGARVYATGDLGRYTANGVIEFLGRKDGQIKIRGQRVEVGEIESALLKHESIKQAVIIHRKIGARQALIAYVIPRTPGPIDKAGLQDFLKQYVPEHMLPDIFVALDAFPMLPNGKLDRRNLPEARHDSVDHTLPRNHIEKVLLQIWLEILRVTTLGIFDNFFQMGGDSILALQVVARARKSGLHIEARQLFQHPTIAELALQSRGDHSHNDAEQGLLLGPLPLTPIQKWYLEKADPNPACCTQSILLELVSEVHPSHIRSAFGVILQHHDALRLCFKRTAEVWEQWYGDECAQEVVEEIHIENASEEQWGILMRSAFERAQSELKPETGPLMRVLFFHCGANASQRLFIIVHHLAIDGVSWQILLEDLHMLLGQSLHEKPLLLTSKTASYRQWAQRLEALARDPAIVAQAHYWKELCRRSKRSNSSRMLGFATAADSRLVRVTLDAAKTADLLRFLAKSSPAFRMDDLLIAAIARQLCLHHGFEFLRIDLEQHGRDEELVNLNLSRTMGWFTAISPVLLRANHSFSLLDYAAGLAKDRLGAPKSSTFGILRYLCLDKTVLEALLQLPPAFVLFNYFGRFDQVFSQMEWFHPAAEGGRPGTAPSAIRPYPLEIDTMIYGDELSIGWCYDSRAGTEAEIQTLSAAVLKDLQSIVGLAEETKMLQEGISPFPGLNLDPKEIQVYAQRFAANRDDL